MPSWESLSVIGDRGLSGFGLPPWIQGSKILLEIRGMYDICLLFGFKTTVCVVQFQLLSVQPTKPFF